MAHYSEEEKHFREENFRLQRKAIEQEETRN